MYVDSMNSPEPVTLKDILPGQAFSVGGNYYLRGAIRGDSRRVPVMRFSTGFQDHFDVDRIVTPHKQAKVIINP